MTSTHLWSSRIVRFLVRLAVAMVAVLSFGCATNPVTGKNEFLITSQEREVRTGEKHFPIASESQGGPLHADPELSAYVSEVGARISQTSDRPDLPYEFVVINSSRPHAWALPGGKIAITRGMLLLLKNEGQLAAVLSHQVVHTAAKHRAKTLERDTMKTVGLTTLALGATMVGVPLIPIVGLASRNEPTHHWLVHAPHTEGEEMEADRYGMEYMERAGYDPGDAVDTLRVLGRHEAQLTPEQEKLTVFTAHPLSRKRIAAARIINYQNDQELGPPLPEPEDRFAERLAWLHNTAPGYEYADVSRTRLIEGDYDSALVLIRQAHQEVPGEPSFHESEGDILMMQDRFEEAFISYDKAIQLRPERASAWVGRGMARKALGDTDNAMADFEISYRIFPNRIASKELRNYVPRQIQANEILDPSTTDEKGLGYPDDPDSPDFATRHEGQLVDVAAPLASTQSADGSEPTAEPASIP